MRAKTPKKARTTAAQSKAAAAALVTPKVAGLHRIEGFDDDDDDDDDDNDDDSLFEIATSGDMKSEIGNRRRNERKGAQISLPPKVGQRKRLIASKISRTLKGRTERNDQSRCV